MKTVYSRARKEEIKTTKKTSNDLQTNWVRNLGTQSSNKTPKKHRKQIKVLISFNQIENIPDSVREI